MCVFSLGSLETMAAVRKCYNGTQGFGKYKRDSKPSITFGVRQASSSIPAAYSYTPLAFWSLLLSTLPFPLFLSAALITLRGAEGHRTERGALYPSAMGMDHFSVREQNFCLGSSVSVCQLGGKS